MYSARILFKKYGSSAFISHLDLMKTLQRSLKRSQLPIKYTQGFNPHIYISILAPLSTGFESDYDLVDIDFTTDDCPSDVISALNHALPMGIEAVEVYQSAAPIKDIAFGKYEIFYPGAQASQVESALKDDMVVTKESKHRTRDIKVQDYIKEIAFEQIDDTAKCTCILSMGEDMLNPMYITQGLLPLGVLDEGRTPRYRRVLLFNKNLEIFK